MTQWAVVSTLLEEVRSDSTGIGKVWMTLLFVFRIMVLGAGAEKVWGDEQTKMICNTKQPGCKNVCYDKAFPISHVRLWALQIIFVSTPTLLYLGHVIHIKQRDSKRREKLKNNVKNERLKKPKYTDDKGKVQIEGSILVSYLISLVFKMILEVAFIMCQHYLYGFVFMAKIVCEGDPCPLMVECFMSRPTEKTIFIIFMLVVSCVSLLLIVVEIFYLIWRSINKTQKTQTY